MWRAIGTRNCTKIAGLLTQSSTALQSVAPRTVVTGLTSLSDFHGPVLSVDNSIFTQSKSTAGAERGTTSGSKSLRQPREQGEQSHLFPKNDAQLAAQVSLLAEAKHTAPLILLVETTLAQWEQWGLDGRPLASTIEAYLAALSRSGAAKTYDAHAFVRDAVERLRVEPSLSLYNAVLCFGVPRKDSADRMLAVLEDMKGQGLMPDWVSYVAAISACTVSRDVRGARRILQAVEGQGLSESLLTEQQRDGFASALVNVAVAASREGRPRESVHLLEHAARLGKPPSLAMVQETMQSAVEGGDHVASLQLVRLLEATAEKAGVRLALDEGQCLSLLNCAANTGSRRLAAASWRLLMRSLEVDPANAGHPKRWPQPACYYAYIDALAHTKQLRQAFDAVSELQAAHPSACAVWDGGLAALVDGLAANAPMIESAKRVLEDMLSEGCAVTPQMSDCIVAAAGQVRDANRAFHLFDSFAELGLGPTADTYAAVLRACIANGVLDSVPMILKEFETTGLAATPALWDALVRFYIVARSPERVVAAVEGMAAAGLRPDARLLDLAIARLEREGDAAGIRVLVARLGLLHYRNFVARRRVQPNRMPREALRTLLGDKFLPRQTILDEMRGAHTHESSVHAI